MISFITDIRLIAHLQYAVSSSILSCSYSVLPHLFTALFQTTVYISSPILCSVPYYLSTYSMSSSILSPHLFYVLFHTIPSPPHLFYVLFHTISPPILCPVPYLSPHLYYVLFHTIPSPILCPVPYYLLTNPMSCSILPPHLSYVLFYSTPSPILCPVPYYLLTYPIYVLFHTTPHLFYVLFHTTPRLFYVLFHIISSPILCSFSYQ
jgi:hypothetical protein